MLIAAGYHLLPPLYHTMTQWVHFLAGSKSTDFALWEEG